MLPKATAKYFEVVNNPQSPRMHTMLGIIDLEKLSLEKAEQLWQRNFSYLALTEEGKSKYLDANQEPETDPTKKYSVSEVIMLIGDCECAKTANEMAALRSDSVKVKEALEQKLVEFNK